ncbi:hypothetical protein [[Limnothrix rosea] IAM M-220]|uniref:hypothetical protein n=1 Tax=[Limnothrix rosea] IAM M-220 TaxID=454133 RepID=UPI0009597C1D|nr:hypothetical protein [[Limnothrix rosea] IAM M-220]OKH15129.1 hypothetical protein NIES208_13110 [[Limnothrix rosea] IAM M-220]
MTTNTSPDLQQLSFQEAITFTQQWLQQVEAQTLPEKRILADLQSLLTSRNGVRGFFVAYLTGNSPLADQVPDTFFEAFRATASEISEIVVKNLAMSTAMAIAHGRNNNLEQQAGSEQVQRRSINLLNTLLDGTDDNPFEQERQALITAIQTEKGKYATFHQKWGYDTEQRQAMQAALEAIA